MPKRYTLDLTMDSPLRGTHRVRANKGTYIQTGQSATLTYNQSSGIDSRAGDEAALEALYTSANGDSWTDNTGWASSGMSLSNSIYGVTVDTIGGELRVTEIDLRVNALGGSDANNLDGSLPVELENLKQCTVFDIRQNFLTGDLPAELSGMTSIIKMRLTGDANEEPNYISGGYHVGKSPSASNRFTGTLKSEWSAWTNIEEFQLERQGQMTGTLPSEWSTWTKIRFFSIYGEFRDYESGFTGTLPTEWSTWSEIVFFTCGRSALSGDLPSEWSTWTKCRTFWPGGTNLNTRPPDSWSVWNLKTMFADRTKPTGELPAFPFNGSWPDLITFSFSLPEGDEYGFTGELPTDWSGVPNINQFSVAGHHLTGSISASIATDIDTGAEIFNLGWQDPGFGFTGSLPDDWTEWRNSASGNRYFRCQGNPITGAIPSVLPYQQSLYLQNCEFSSATPQAFIDWYNHGVSRWGASSLELEINGNRLTPKDIEPALSTLTGMDSLDYGSQNPFGDGGSASVGDTLDLSEFAHTGNSYQWQESSTEGGTYSNLSGETANTLDTTSHGVGFYKMLIDHPDFAQTFESKPIEAS